MLINTNNITSANITSKHCTRVLYTGGRFCSGYFNFVEVWAVVVDGPMITFPRDDLVATRGFSVTSSISNWLLAYASFGVRYDSTCPSSTDLNLIRLFGAISPKSSPLSSFSYCSSVR